MIWLFIQLYDHTMYNFIKENIPVLQYVLRNIELEQRNEYKKYFAIIICGCSLLLG